ncbi:hypothetical protein TSUD_286420 [Trifolium subterraneum]|uniref:Uncharacterized protein n=1 Tax=Trifolium subterraneum TaxID=3900 RepID=A0A2Z6PBE7_TRISU|nr:hypothetical protein TSUD_286420 [Trifolium subterraneum]
MLTFLEVVSITTPIGMSIMTEAHNGVVEEIKVPLFQSAAMVGGIELEEDPDSSYLFVFIGMSYRATAHLGTTDDYHIFSGGGCCTCSIHLLGDLSPDHSIMAVVAFTTSEVACSRASTCHGRATAATGLIMTLWRQAQR